MAEGAETTRREQADEPVLIQLTPEQYPWDLLLLADPSRSRIEQYIRRSLVTGLTAGGRIVGVVVLALTGEGVFEVMNIAVSEAEQGKGYGKRLLNAAVQAAAERGASRVEVGTGDSPPHLAFYEQAGFRVAGVDRDYFIRNYPEPIIDNGVLLRDMIRLAREL